MHRLREFLVRLLIDEIDRVVEAVLDLDMPVILLDEARCGYAAARFNTLARARSKVPIVAAPSATN